MFWSKYNILSKSNKYGYLLFNTMSLVFIRILEEDINTWLELKDNPDSYKNFCNSDFLLEARIIVENQEDDLNVYLADILKNRYNSSDMALTILPTRGCNFGCIYCYNNSTIPRILQNVFLSTVYLICSCPVKNQEISTIVPRSTGINRYCFKNSYRAFPRT